MDKGKLLGGVSAFPPRDTVTVFLREQGTDAPLKNPDGSRCYITLKTHQSAAARQFYERELARGEGRDEAARERRARRFIAAMVTSWKLPGANVPLSFDAAFTVFEAHPWILEQVATAMNEDAA